MKGLIKKLILPVIVLVAAGILAGSYFIFIKPPKEQGEKEVSVKIVYSENEFSYSVNTNEYYLEGLLVALDKAEGLSLVLQDGAYGKYIKSLLFVDEDDKSGNYYLVYVNGELAPLGISETTVKNNDEIKIVYGALDWESGEVDVGGKGQSGKTFKTTLIVCLIAGVLAVAGLSYGLAVIIKKYAKSK